MSELCLGWADKKIEKVGRDYDYAVFVGRFQPVHEGHLNVFKAALETAGKVIVLLGSSNRARSAKNPWSAEERQVMIHLAVKEKFGDAAASRLIFRPISDYSYNDQKWAMEIQKSVAEVIYGDFSGRTKMCLIGYEKDETSYYLKMFPQWDYIEVTQEGILSATDLRMMLFENSFDVFAEDAEKVIPPSVLRFIESWSFVNEFEHIREEYLFVKRYLDSWKFAPYAPTFVTADAVVIESGHILLIKRGAQPGKGLYALPGGYLNQKESVVECSVRELREETRLKVAAKILRGSIKKTVVFDKPDRDPRGRFITHASLIELPPCPDGNLSPVKGGDDAAEAMWIPLSHLDTLKTQFFVDHWDIIQYMLGDV